MITPEQQKEFIDMVKAATHGLKPELKRATQIQLATGAVMMLSICDQCPPTWKSLVMIGRAYKLFSR